MGGRPQRAAHPRRPAPPEVCAETHCAVLVQKGAVFENCHATVDPKPFYKVGGGVGMEGPQGRLSGFERTLMATVPAEVRVPGLQLRGDIPAHLRRPRRLRARMRLPGRPAAGLEELNVAVRAWELLKEVAIIFFTSTIV